MYKKQDLFNIDILVLNSENVRTMKEITTGAIFIPNSKKFHPEGLYSNEIFGPVGSKARNEQYGYIDLKLPILHPFVYETLISLGTKYLQIAEGKKFAVYDKNIQDLVITLDGKGSTGYNFLLNNVHRINFKENDSDQRKYKLDLIRKFANEKHMSTKWLVLPAGLRDYTETDKGNPSEDEINTLYRKLLSVTNMLRNTNVGENLELMDPFRLKIQKTTLEIFQYIKTLLDGKSKFIQGKFTKRATKYGTRNVLTPIPAKISNLNDPTKISLNDTQVGLYQYIKATTPITINRVHTLFINKILNPNSDNAYLVNPKTMETELVRIKAKKRDEWFSSDGMNSIMNKLGQADLRLEPVMVDGYYLLLLKDDGKNITVYRTSQEIPEEDKKYIRPITYAELFYISVYDIKNKYPCFVTRYPVAGQGGIYPSNIYLKTTQKARTVNFTMGIENKVMLEYPVLGEIFVDSISVNLNMIKNLGADFKYHWSLIA